MHFSGSSKSDCLALVEAFKVSLSHPLEAEVATPSHQCVLTPCLREWRVLSSPGAGRTHGGNQFPRVDEKVICRRSVFSHVLTLELNPTNW